MGKHVVKTESKAQKTAETLLSVFAAVVGEYWLFVTLCAYVLDSLSDTTLTVGRCLSFLFFGCAALYGVVRWAKDGFSRIKDFCKQLFCKEQLLLACLVICYVISCKYMSSETGNDVTSWNRYYLFDSFLSVFVLFPLPLILKKRPYILRLMLHLLLVVTAVFDVWILHGVFKPSVVTVAGNQIGMTEKFTLSIACNVNTTGAFHALLFMLCVYMVVSEKCWLKFAYVPVALMHLVMVSLSNSRTAFYAPLISFTALVLVLMFRYLRSKGKSIAVSGIFSVLPAALVAFGFYHFHTLSYLVYDWFTDGIRLENGGAARPIMDGLSKRDLLWKSFLPAVTESIQRFLFGVTPVYVEQQITAQGIIDATGHSYMHNEYLQMGVAFGIPAMLIYTVWSVLLAGKCLKLFKSAAGITLAATIFMLVLSNMFESYLFAFAYFCGGVFFLLAGMANAQSGIGETEIKA